ncbi:hypothetical protein BCU94_17400 [Shewanella sp. 10N.286.52.C2]|uniref:hypothetical protein n=1 Tax=unclassified Shewanella TaxID=196818 RepID=UPI000CBAAB45|nr:MULTISPECIES: hypothetical protein [unclassified Shewanella]MDO6641620.1 hypothetical protein [Shewanella sp. 5_MG-2023]PMG28459.1 hypothetical protein BCU94_17400 [Shewanella sp. 10N.286.52.C2]
MKFKKLPISQLSVSIMLFLAGSVTLQANDLAEVGIELDAAKAAIDIDENSFSCIRDMTPVRHFYVDNILGDLDATLAVANAPEGAKYPPGSVVQLVPTEVMVKGKAGSSPVTGDWEFFELEVSEDGSKIVNRGFVDVNNRFGGNCFTCHLPARDKWDFICESNHGCEPIPIDHSMTGALQRSDPRCGEEALESGDSMALFKLKTMVVIGSVKKWFEDLF